MLHGKKREKAFNYKCINQPTNAHFEVSPLESAFGREVEMYALHNFLTVIYTQQICLAISNINVLCLRKQFELVNRQLKLKSN